MREERCPDRSAMTWRQHVARLEITIVDLRTEHGGRDRKERSSHQIGEDGGSGSCAQVRHPESTFHISYHQRPEEWQAHDVIIVPVRKKEMEAPRSFGEQCLAGAA